LPIAVFWFLFLLSIASGFLDTVGNGFPIQSLICLASC
jgi:hypothetical protein